jgi:hypothetical protein
MILIDKKKAVFAKSYITKKKNEIGDGKYVQSPQDLLSKLPTNKEGYFVQVGPAGSPILLNDTFHGTIEYNDASEITGFDFSKKRAEAGPHLVHFCNTATIEPDGVHYRDMKPEYYQSYGHRNGNATIVIQQEDVELYIFLSDFCRKVKNSLNAHANTIKDYVLEISNPEKSAAEEASKRRPRLKAERLIFEDPTEGGMTEAQLDMVARHLGLPIEQYKTTALKQKAIWAAIVADETSRKLSGDSDVYGYEFLAKLSENKGPDFKLRELVTLALKERCISMDTKRKMFVFIGGPNDDIIGTICPYDDAAPIKINVLITYLKFNPEVEERIHKLVYGDFEPEQTPKVKKAGTAKA